MNEDLDSLHGTLDYNRAFVRNLNPEGRIKRLYAGFLSASEQSLCDTLESATFGICLIVYRKSNQDLESLLFVEITMPLTMRNRVDHKSVEELCMVRDLTFIANPWRT
jgi:hypothetical protein